MSTWRVAAIVLGCGVVAMGAAASAGACVYARRPVAPIVSGTPLAHGVRQDVRPDGIGLAALELPSRPSLSPRRRNLFRLRERSSVPTPAQVRVMPASREFVDQPQSQAPAPPPLTLAGIGESQQGDRAVRTAVISGAGELWLMTEGMVVAGRYRVDRIDRDAVVLVDTAGGQSRTLRLR